MERLTVSQPHLEEANSANTNEVAEIEHFAEQLVGHMAKDHHESSQNTTNSDHTTKLSQLQLSQLQPWLWALE